MSDLRRWLDDAPPPEVRRLLEVGQWARPSDSLLEQTLARVQAGPAEGALDAGFPTEQGSALRSGIKWSVVGALLLGGAGVLTYGMRPDESARTKVDALPSEPAKLAPTAPAASPAVARPEAKPEVPAALPVTRPPSVQDEPSKPRAVAAPASGPARAVAAAAKVCKPGVVEQIEMLERAKNLIAAGRGSRALAILDRYDSFGAGRCFVPESLKHRMDAYKQMGNAGRAEQTAASIKDQYPDTAQARAADAVLKHK